MLKVKTIPTHTGTIKTKPYTHTHTHTQAKVTVTGIQNYFNTYDYLEQNKNFITSDIKDQSGVKTDKIDTLGERAKKEWPLYEPTQKPNKHEWVRVSLSTPFAWSCATCSLMKATSWKHACM